MEDGTSVAERNLSRAPQHFGRIVIVGGGCYGSYYVRQLRRARAAGAVTWASIIVVDRDPQCAVARLADADRPPALHTEAAEWDEYFWRFLSDAGDRRDESAADAIVPSPLMPHLMANWLLLRARDRWPNRHIEVVPLQTAPTVPWQMTGVDHTQYVSFAEWVCPINCIEPAVCPATKGERSWSMPTALSSYVKQETDGGRPIGGPFVFHCSHRAYGVGMIDVTDVLDADTSIAERGHQGAASFLVGTVSHCHGALQRIEVGSIPDTRKG